MMLECYKYAASVVLMGFKSVTIFGILVFILGWIYAISAFGFFLGVGLGWFPAIVIAWIADVVALFVLGALLTAVSQNQHRTINPVKIFPRFSLPKFRLPFSKKHVVGVLVMGAIGLSSFFLLRNEVNGSCDRVRTTSTKYIQTLMMFALDGVNTNDLQTFSYGQLVVAYGEGVARDRILYSNAKRDFQREHRSLEFPSYCFEKDSWFVEYTS